MQLHLLQVALENDSESPSALKSNMAAGEIRFSAEKIFVVFAPFNQETPAAQFTDFNKNYL